ncbi:MAG: c-type cytochrome [Fidelibacterota bacterium]
MIRGLILLFLGLLVPLGSAQDQEEIEKGRKIYIESCALCHGVSGKGDGPVAGNLSVKPRNFTDGKFKLRSTSSGQVPLDNDLYRTLGRGMGHDNAMPAWSNLPTDHKKAVIQYIKTFAPRKFARQDRVRVVSIPPRKPATPESIAAGREWYMAIECWKCHGVGGHADGPSTPTLKDTWGEKIVPPDLSKPWLFIGGSEPEEIYRTLSTGLTGSAMPAVEGTLTEEQTWDLVNFLLHEFIEPGKNVPR